MNEQPHLEILSHNRVNRSTIIIGVIPVTAVTIIFVAAVWPFLSWIAYGSLSLLVLAALYLVARAFLDVRRRWLHDAIIQANEYGVVNVAAWQHLPTRLLAAPVQVTEVKAEPDRSAEEEGILEMHTSGQSFKSIASQMKDLQGPKTYWTEYRVRQLCNSRPID